MPRAGLLEDAGPAVVGRRVEGQHGDQAAVHAPTHQAQAGHAPAVARNRADTERRWVEAVLEMIARQPPVGTPDGPFQRDLAGAISQPLPGQLHRTLR